MLLNELKERDGLTIFLEEHGGTSPKLELLLFWGRHPRAKFTLACIAAALDVRRLYLQETLESLVKEDIIEAYEDHNGTTWYSASPYKRDYLEALIRLGWSEIKHWKDCYNQRLAISGA